MCTAGIVLEALVGLSLLLVSCSKEEPAIIEGYWQLGKCIAANGVDQGPRDEFFPLMFRNNGFADGNVITDFSDPEINWTYSYNYAVQGTKIIFSEIFEFKPDSGVAVDSDGNEVPEEPTVEEPRSFNVDIIHLDSASMKLKGLAQVGYPIDSNETVCELRRLSQEELSQELQQRISDELPPTEEPKPIEEPIPAPDAPAEADIE